MKIDQNYLNINNIATNNQKAEEPPSETLIPSRFNVSDTVELSEDALLFEPSTEGSGDVGGAPDVPPIKDKPKGGE